MKSLVVFPLVLVALLCFASAEEEAVVTLGDGNFTEAITQNDFVLAEFYAPWCGHCKKLAPEYEKAAQKLENEEVMLAKIDATVHKDLATKYEVRGYPTLKFFSHGKPMDYDGPRTADGIVSWLEMRTGPPVKEMEEGELAAFKEGKEVVFVLKAKSKESDAAKSFTEASQNHLEKGSFVMIVHGSDDVIEVHRSGEEPIKSPNGAASTDVIEKFILKECFPPIGPIHGENYRKYTERGLDLAWVIASKEDYEATLKKVITGVAENYREDYSFVWLDAVEYKSHAEAALGVSEFPVLVLQIGGSRYVEPTQNFEHGVLDKFIKEVKAGKIDKSLKSEPVPEQTSAVYQIVGTSFEEIVLDPKKDVFLEVYAPWCGHCKKLEPIYQQLADKHKSVEHVLIARLDGTANEIPVDGFDWDSFPTLMFIKAGEKKPIPFDGDRTLEAMSSFIQTHTTKKFTVEDDGHEEEL